MFRQVYQIFWNPKLPLKQKQEKNYNLGIRPSGNPPPQKVLQLYNGVG